ncbi:MAG TPA: DUF72 domain-containing protein, partial [Candidatus Paceibacterota bacterium]|nr:DUF72 domain-containing protein [Candidatus Paceibacterota bacterium]
WEEITVPAYPSGLRYAKKAGPNPHFLDAKYVEEQVLSPFDEAFQEHTGPFIFEFQRTGIEAKEFLLRLDEFLGHLPKRYEYAVEVRNPAVLGTDYRSILEAHQVSHVYNYLYAVPSLDDQHEKLGEQFTASFVLFRLLTPRDKKYHDAVRTFEPYDKLKQPLPDMRDQTVKLVKQAIMEQRRAYVLVNNRTEGNAPQTTKALYARLRQLSL